MLQPLNQHAAETKREEITHQIQWQRPTRWKGLTIGNLVRRRNLRSFNLIGSICTAVDKRPWTYHRSAVGGDQIAQQNEFKSHIRSLGTLTYFNVAMFVLSTQICYILLQFSPVRSDSMLNLNCHPPALLILSKLQHLPDQRFSHFFSRDLKYTTNRPQFDLWAFATTPTPKLNKKEMRTTAAASQPNMQGYTIQTGSVWKSERLPIPWRQLQSSCDLPPTALTA